MKGIDHVVNEYNFSFKSKFGELRGSSFSSYQKEYDDLSVDNIIDEFILHCACIGLDISLCRLIKCISINDGYTVSDCLNHYIGSITRRERYGISNDAILVKVAHSEKYRTSEYFIEQLATAGFIPIDFIGHDPDIKYYAHENDFIRAIITKSGGN